MRVVAQQKQQFGFLILLTGMLFATAQMLASASTERTLMYVIGTIAAVLAFLNEELAIHFLIIAMLLSPEVDVGKTSGASLGRSVTLRVDDLVLLVICLTWFLKSVLYKEIGLLKHTPLNGAMYLYSFAALFSTMLGMLSGNVDPKTGTLFVLKYIEYFLIFWMVVNTAREEAQIRRFLLVAIVVALIVTVIAIAQIPQGVRVSAPFEGERGEPNTFGGYLLFMMTILAAFVLVDNSYRWPAAILFSLLFTAFIYTLSRASYLGFIAVAFVLPVLTRRYMLLIAVLILSLVIVMYAEVVLPTAVYERISFTFNQQAQSSQVKVLGTRVDTSTSARLLYMQAAIDAFFEKPIFGWGVTGWHFLDSQYFRSLSETGLFGFSTLVFLLFRIIQVALRSFHLMKDKDPFNVALVTGFVAGTVGLMVHAIGSNTFIIVRIMEPFWLVCALVYLLPIVTAPETEQHA